jgi:Yip1 domain
MIFIEFFYKPEKTLHKLKEKPNIVIPIFLALITPLFQYQTLSTLIPENLHNYTNAIIIISGLFSLFSYFISAFLIYIFIAFFPLEDNINFKQILSIYGFVQIPRLFQSIAAYFNLIPINLQVNNLKSYLLDQVILNPFFYWESYLSILAISIITKLNKLWAFFILLILMILKLCSRLIFF